MKMKKIVSAFSALAMTVTAMAGLAVTANAAGEELDVVTIEDASADVRQNFTKNQVVGETIVYEFDVYVPDGTKTSVAYYSGGNLGPTFILDAQQEAGKVWVEYQIAQSGPYEINRNSPYSWYLADSWAHVAISNPIGTDGSIGDATIQFSSVDGNDTPFTQTDDEGTTVRHPYNDRQITHRNIYGGRLFDNIRLTFDNAGTEGVQVTNQKIYTVASNLTVNAPNATISGLPTDTKSYDAVSGLIADNTYNLTITPNENYTLDAVKVNGTEVEAVEGIYTVMVNADTTIDVETTEITPPEPEETTADEVEVPDTTGVKAFKVTEFALNGTAPTWSITATPAEGDAQIQTIEAEIANVEAGNVSLGLIIDNVPENVTVSATLGY